MIRNYWLVKTGKINTDFGTFSSHEVKGTKKRDNLEKDYL